MKEGVGHFHLARSPDLARYFLLEPIYFFALHDFFLTFSSCKIFFSNPFAACMIFNRAVHNEGLGAGATAPSLHPTPPQELLFPLKVLENIASIKPEIAFYCYLDVQTRRTALTREQSLRRFPRLLKGFFFFYNISRTVSRWSQ